MIHKQLAAVMTEISHVAKSQLNKAQGFKFRGIDDVYNAVHSAMAKHGVTCWPEIMDVVYREKIQSRGGGEGWHMILRVKYRFAAEDGSQIETVVFGEGMDYGDKCCNKCLAIAHKYALLQTFVIPTEETDDPDKESHEVIPAAPPAAQKRPVGRPPKADKPTGDKVGLEMTMDIRKTELIVGVRQLAEKIDLKAKVGKTIQEIVDKINSAATEAQLDKMEAYLMDLEADAT